MCIIAVSMKGAKQPTLEQLKNMFTNNPDGAGYMYARKGVVHIHKGFMLWEDFIRAVKAENFGPEDPVVYHFRISTQAGVNPRMTHPFPLTPNLLQCEALDVDCKIGLAHNGIIRMTSSVKETRYSDTALFISSYMTKLIRHRSDVNSLEVLNMIDHLTNSKWAILTADGDIRIVGHFVGKDGLLFSNSTYEPSKWAKGGKKAPYAPRTTITPPYVWDPDDYDAGYYGYTYYPHGTTTEKLDSNKRSDAVTKSLVTALNNKR